MDYDESKIRRQVIAGLRNPEPWRVEMEEIDYGKRLGVFYRSPNGVRRFSTDTSGKTEDQIAFALVRGLLDAPVLPPVIEAILKIAVASIQPPSPYEGRRGKHPKNCTCSKHKAVNGAQAA